MSRAVRAYSVFVASPGDVAAEREAVMRAADRVNATVGRAFELRLEVRGWEQVQPTLGRAQAAINPLVDECHVFVGVLWRRFGTPTGDYGSGFEEEFHRALARQEENPPPVVGLFFRQVTQDLLDDPGRELNRVLKLQRRIRKDHVALYRSYGDPAGFELDVTQFLTAFLVKKAAEAIAPPQGIQSLPAEGEASARGAGPDIDTAAGRDSDELDDARRQIGGVLDEWSGSVLGRRPPHPSADTDRLVAFALAMSHDDTPLPVHTANRLYLRHTDLVLSRGEAALWLRTLCGDAIRAVDGWGGTIPGWRLLHHSQLQDDLLDVALQRQPGPPRGAVLLLLAMRARPAALWQRPVTDGEQSERPGEDDGAGPADSDGGTARPWPLLLSVGETADEAVEYLYRLAGEEDVAVLDAVEAAAQGEQWGDAALAAVAALRGSPFLAVDWLLSNPYTIAEWAIEAVIRAVPDLPPPRLVDLVSSRHRAEPVRLAAFNRLTALAADGEVDAALGERAVAAILATGGAALDLVLSPGSAGSPVGGWLAPAWAARDSKEQHRLGDRVMAALHPSDELAVAAVHGLAGLDAWRAWSWLGDPAQGPAAREVLRDGGAAFTANAGALDLSDELVQFVRGHARAAALRVLRLLPEDARRHGDVVLVRDELALADWLTAEEAQQALTVLGDPCDADALVAAAGFTVAGAADARQLLRAACRLGGAAVVNALLDGDDETGADVAALVVAEDASTAENVLVDLLHHHRSGVRRHALNALVGRLDDKALLALLDSYPTRRTSYYYDVVCRLDWLLFADPDGLADPAVHLPPDPGAQGQDQRPAGAI